MASALNSCEFRSLEKWTATFELPDIASKPKKLLPPAEEDFVVEKKRATAPTAAKQKAPALSAAK